MCGLAIGAAYQAAMISTRCWLAKWNVGRFRLACALALVGLSSCAYQIWEKPNGSQQVYIRNKNNCKRL